jgi:hypothetical protein
MSTATIEPATETLPAVTPDTPATAPEADQPAPAAGQATGREYPLIGSYRKLSRGLAPRRRLWMLSLEKYPDFDGGVALAQAIRQAGLIARYLDGGVQVLIDGVRYAVTLKREGLKTVLVIGERTGGTA